MKPPVKTSKLKEADALIGQAKEVLGTITLQDRNDLIAQGQNSDKYSSKVNFDILMIMNGLNEISLNLKECEKARLELL